MVLIIREKMERKVRNRLAQKGMEAMEKLDLPEILPGGSRMELMGNRGFYMDRHKGVLSYTTQQVDINSGTVIVRLYGRELQLLVMTDEELRITGIIEKVELVE